ncbi:MAG: MBL fold metallo-hydrolase [Firmicutes bacterium]|nr:MBL fold metallo-hydrolase [Bacillota bacterium]
MSFELKIIKSGVIDNNTYILTDKATKKTVIIDPAFAASKIIAYIKENELQPCAIINTHGHYDHITANMAVRDEFNIPVYMHEADIGMIKENGRYGFDVSKASPVDYALQGGEELQFGELQLKIIHTPGHSRGGICILCEDKLFTGDTLFYHDIGRCDLEGGSLPQLLKSIKEKLLVLPDEVIVYPGHDRASSIGDERKKNSYLQ